MFKNKSNNDKRNTPFEPTGSVFKDTVSMLQSIQGDATEHTEQQDHTGHEKHSVLGKLNRVLGAVSKGAHVVKTHMPSVLHKVEGVLEVVHEMFHDETSGDAVEDKICGAVVGTVKVAAGAVIMTFTPEIEVAAGITGLNAAVGFGAGAVLQSGFEAAINPVGEAVKDVCHGSFALAKDILESSIENNQHTPNPNSLHSTEGMHFMYSYHPTPENDAEVTRRISQYQRRDLSSSQQEEFRQNVIRSVYDPNSETAREMNQYFSRVDQERLTRRSSGHAETALNKTCPQPARSTPKNLSAEPKPSVHPTPRVDRKAADNATAQAEGNAARVHSSSPQVRWLLRTIPKDLLTAEQYEAIFSSNDPTGKTQSDAFREMVKTLPAEQQQQVGEAFARNIRHEVAHIASTPAPKSPKEVSSYVENVHAVTFLASVFTQFVTSPRASKAIHFCMQAATASAPLIQALLAGKAATLSMSATATGGFILAGMAAASMFGLMDDEGSDNGLSALSAQLEAIAASIVQISQQLVQLGKAIDYRFDELERRLDKQHQVTLQQLRVIVFNLDGKEDALTALIRDGHAEMFKRFDALNLAVQTIDKHQTEAIAIGIERQYALDRRLDSLETLWDRRLVLEAGLTAKRPLELKQDGPRLSKQLLLSIKNCRGGSASLTGADLPVQLNEADAASLVLLRERWLTPYEKSDRAKEPETLKRLAGQNIDALVRYAGLQPDYPNLGLLMERVKAFIDFYTAYRDTVSQQIPQEMDQDLRDVIAYVGEVVLKIQAINPREVLPRMFADLVKLNDQALQAIEAEKSTFIQTKKTDSWNRRIQRLEQLKKEIGQTAMPPISTIPVENQMFRYTKLVGHVLYKGPDHENYRSIQLPHSLKFSEHVGLQVIYTQNIAQQLAEVDSAIAMAVLNKDIPEQLAIYHRDYLKDAFIWKSTLSLGPRLIKPEPGLGIGLSLYCDGRLFDKFVPQQAFIHEDNGEGEVCLTYRSWFEARVLHFQLKIMFLPKKTGASAEVFYQETCTLSSVAPTYNNIEEVILAWAQSEPIFTAEKISLNCDMQHEAPDHRNFFYRVIKPQALLSQLAVKPVNQTLYTQTEQRIHQLAQECMFSWRKELNQSMLNAYQHYAGSIGTELVKSEALALMIKSLVMMIMPEHHDTFFQAFTDEAIKRHRDMLQTLTDLTPVLQGSSLKALDLAFLFKIDVKNGAEGWAKEVAAVLAGALRVGDSDLELQYDALVAIYATLGVAREAAGMAHPIIVEQSGYETDPEASDRLHDLIEDFMATRGAALAIKAYDVEEDSDAEPEDESTWIRPADTTRRGLFIFNGLFSKPKDNRAFASHLEKECGKDRVFREKDGEKRLVVDMGRQMI